MGGQQAQALQLVGLLLQQPLLAAWAARLLLYGAARQLLDGAAQLPPGGAAQPLVQLPGEALLPLPAAAWAVRPLLQQGEAQVHLRWAAWLGELGQSRRPLQGASQPCLLLRGGWQLQGAQRAAGPAAPPPLAGGGLMLQLLLLLAQLLGAAQALGAPLGAQSPRLRGVGRRLQWRSCGRRSRLTTGRRRRRRAAPPPPTTRCPAWRRTWAAGVAWGCVQGRASLRMLSYVINDGCGALAGAGGLSGQPDRGVECPGGVHCSEEGMGALHGTRSTPHWQA